MRGSVENEAAEPKFLIAPYTAWPKGGPGGAGEQLDAIFFEASSVKAFPDEVVRDAFRWRWLGRYLADEPEHAFVATTNSGGIVGYLVGSLTDPALGDEFSELGYFRDFAGMTASYPAHLHVNVATDMRSLGVGEALVEAFCRHAHSNGVGGVHVVTGEGMRNVRFYARLGFREVARTAYKDGLVVMLARKL